MKTRFAGLPAFPHFAAALLALAATAHAATLTVTTAVDEFDSPSGAALSLREALRDAAALAGPDAIVFAPTLNGQTLSLGSELVVADTAGVTVNASALAGGVTLSGGGTKRIFSVSTGASLTLDSLTLTAGYGSIAASAGNGGAIFSTGTVAATACTFSANTAESQGGVFANGNGGVATFTRCTFSGNQQTGGGGVGGGAINHASTATSMTLTHCTLAGNSSAGSQGGGAIRNRGNQTLTLSYCLIAGNSVSGSGTGADVNSTVGVTLTGANLIQTALSGGGSYTGSGSAPITTAPSLGALASNGGPTQTRALLAGSAGIDAATGSSATVDQRGFTVVATPDLGAYESGGGITVITSADSGVGSLRQALADAAAAPGANTITFAPVLNGGTITLTSGQIVINDASGVTLDASSLASGLTISGNNANRIFVVNSGATLALRGLTLTGGNRDGLSGGAISNSGTLALTQCTLFGNHANNGLPGFGGGAIFNATGGTLTLTQCTLSGNHADGGSATGGAIRNGGTLTLTHCTLSGNHSDGGSGGAIYNSADTLTLTNSIVAGNTRNGAEDNIYGTAPTAASANNLTSGDPLLAPLGNYGGPTQTMPPLPGSPAIDAATVLPGLPTDQRGAPRPSGSAPDIGAVELGQTTVTTDVDENNGLGTGDKSLREALTDPALFGSELVRFDATLNGGLLTPGSEIAVSKPLTCVDATSLTSGLTISGSNLRRIFTVSSGATVALRGLTLKDGNADFSLGGGAISNFGTLTLTHCTLSGNHADNSDLGGGAIYNGGTLTLTQCTLSGNHANNSSDGGGAIYNDGGTLMLTQCTLSGNHADNSLGGAILNNGPLTLTNSIVTGNTATGGSGPDIRNFSTITPAGVNFVGDPAGSGLSASATIRTTAANGPINLAVLNNFGGPMKTMPPLPGSPAIDAATVIAGLTTDQRGFPLPADGDGNGTAVPDIGAVELTSPYVVTQTGDSGSGSLRQAVEDAAVQPGTQTITFAPGFTGPIVLTSGEIVLGSSATLDASTLASGLTVSGNNARRIFNVNSGQTVTLRNLTLTGGYGVGATDSGYGGAIRNTGNLTAERCTFANNTASNGGGAIINLSPSASATLMLTQCTFSGNTSASHGGAIFNLYSNSALTLTHCTLTSNAATGNGGGVFNNAGTVTLANSIVAGNSSTANPASGDIRNESSGTCTRTGANLVQALDNQATLNGPGTIINAAPLLAPLGNYGGPTQTRALLPASPALDAATVIAGPTTDQRGFPRNRNGDATAGAMPDIGAYEAQAAPFSIGFNMGDTGVSGGDTLAAADIAGVPAFAQGNWNHLAGPGNSGGLTPDTTTRTDASGAAIPGLKLWWKGPNTWRLGGAADTPDKKLMFGYLDSNATGDGSAATDLFSSAAAQPWVAIAGLPAALTLGGYRVLVYMDTDNSVGRISRYWLTSNRAENPAAVGSESMLTGSIFTRDTANFSGTYTRATATTDTGAATPGGNYALFENLTEPGGFIVRAEEGSEPASNQARAPINAVHLVRNEIVVVTTALDENDPNGTPGAGLSLREAIRDAAPGSGIVFDPTVFNGEPADTITFPAANPGLVLDKDLTIDAGNIPGGVTVNAAASNTNQKRIFTLPAGRTAALLGLNLTGAYNTTLDSGYGGAIHSQGRLSLTACRLTANVASEGGAAVCHAATQPAQMILRHCTVSSNQGLGHAGAIEVWAAGHMAELHLEDSTLSGNTTPGYGGAVWAYAEGARSVVTARRTTMTANQGYLGGAFNNQSVTTGSAELTLSHCTIAGNIASTAGGGIISSHTSTPTATAPVTLAHTIIAGNSAPSAAFGPDLIKDGANASFTSLGGNLIGKTNASGATWLGSDLTGTVAAPRDALLAPLGDYGGPTQTMALLPGSPARNAAVGSLATADQRGFPKVGAEWDIGAYEAGTFSNFNAYIWESLPASATPEQHAASFDFDGDGAGNEEEWIAGTNAANSTSFFRVTERTLSGGTFSVTFPTVMGRNYQLQSSPDPASAWTDVGSTTPGTGGDVTLPANVSGWTKYFFRVKVTRP